MPNVVLRSFQVFGANDEILDLAVDEVTKAIKTAKASGTVQVVSLFRKGYRVDLQVGDVYVVPPAVCNSAEDFPFALLTARIRHHATAEGQIEFDMGQLIDKEDLSNETLKAFQKVVFREGGEGDLKPLIVFRACWSSPYDALGFLYDEKTLRSNLREVAYAAPFNPALSSVLDALKSCSDAHAAFVITAPVTQHIFTVTKSDEPDYPDFVPGMTYPAAEEDGRTKKTANMKRIYLTAGVQHGSQYRESLEESGYELVDIQDDEAILRNKNDGSEELWVERDDHAGYTIEINGVGYEYIRDIPTAKRTSALRRPVLRITAGNIPAIEKEVLSDDELKMFANMDQELGDTVVASENAGLRDSPLAGLITAAVKVIAEEQPATYVDNDFGKGDAGLRHRPDYGEKGSVETITPAMVDGPDPKTAAEDTSQTLERKCSPGEPQGNPSQEDLYRKTHTAATNDDRTSPSEAFAQGVGNVGDLMDIVSGMGEVAETVAPLALAAGLIIAGAEDPLSASDNPLTDSARTAAVGDAHQVDEFDKLHGKPQERTTPGSTTTLTETIMDVRHPSQHIDQDTSGGGNGSDGGFGGGESGGDMGGGSVTAGAAPGPWVVIDVRTGKVKQECKNKGEATKVYNKLNAQYLSGDKDAPHYEMKSKAYHEELQPKPKKAGVSAEVVRAVQRFVDNFGGHYMPLKALQEELSRLTSSVKEAVSYMNMEGLIKPYGQGVKVQPKGLQSAGVLASPRRPKFLIKSASGQCWACSDVDGVKMAGYWTDAEADAHNFIDESEAHEEVRRNVLDREGAIVIPDGIAPLPKLARSWWAPGRAIKANYPELFKDVSHVPGKRAAKKVKADSWFEPGRVLEQFGGDLANNTAPNFPGEISQEEGPYINPWGAPGNETPQAPVSLSGIPEGMNKEYDGVPLKQESNFYGPEFMREFYEPETPDIDLTAKHSSWLRMSGKDSHVTSAYAAGKAAAAKDHLMLSKLDCFVNWAKPGKEGNLRASLKGLDGAEMKKVKEAFYAGFDGKVAPKTASSKTAAPGAPTPTPNDATQNQTQQKAPSFLDAMNMAKPEPEPKTPYIDPTNNGDGIDNPSPAYLMIDKLMKGVMGAYVAQLIGAFEYTRRPLELETPFDDKIDLQEVLAFGGGTTPTAQNAAKQQLSHALELLSDDEKKQIVNDGQAQAAVWCESNTGAGGYTYEVFARVEAIEGSVISVKAITGIR